MEIKSFLLRRNNSDVNFHKATIGKVSYFKIKNFAIFNSNIEVCIPSDHGAICIHSAVISSV